MKTPILRTRNVRTKNVIKQSNFEKQLPEEKAKLNKKHMILIYYKFIDKYYLRVLK